MTDEALIDAALAEDLGSGDLSSLHFIPAEAKASARVMAREPGVMAAGQLAKRVFERVDPAVHCELRLADGSAFEAGQCLLQVAGSARSLLSAERTALNFLQRLCGVATQARRYVQAVAGHPVTILDTRKTTPGWRRLEKAAVLAGGASNHRMGLYDQVMLKDNHLAAQGDLTALQQALDQFAQTHPEVRVQLECDTLEQVRQFLSLRGVHMLLLDNMSPAQLREAVALNAGRLWLEASGGITLERIAEVAATGVNAISVGALTHSVRALDLGLDFD